MGIFDKSNKEIADYVLGRNVSISLPRVLVLLKLLIRWGSRTSALVG